MAPLILASLVALGIFVDDGLRMIEVLVWPVVLVFALMIFKKDIQSLVQRIRRFTTDAVEISFESTLNQLSNESGSEPDIKQALVSAKTDRSPRDTVLAAWDSLESSARRKIEDLMPPDEVFQEPVNRPLDYLEYKGALTPSAARIIWSLRSLRNQVLHFDSAAISSWNADRYAHQAAAMHQVIDAIVELPKVRLTALTLLILKINALIDTGEFDDITINEVREWIETKSILPTLDHRAKEYADFSSYRSEGPYTAFVAFYHERMAEIAEAYAGDEKRRWMVENRGLCLLLAWTNELVEQGSGWYPNEA